MIIELLWRFFDSTWIMTALLGLLTYFVARHLIAVYLLPRGPFPVPLIGNLLNIIPKVSELHLLFQIWHKKYGESYTIWMGYTPVIVFNGWRACKEALITKKNDFSGRIKRHSIEMFLGGGEDVIFSDFGPCFETLRGILVMAVRKYSVSEKLAALSTDIVDEVVDLMIKEGKPVDASEYTYLALYSILASSAFGQRYGLNDPEFVALRDANERMRKGFEELMAIDGMPILKIFYRKQEKSHFHNCQMFMSFFKKHFEEHKRTYKKDCIRDFMDSVIAAREEAKKESKDSIQYMLDINLITLTMDLFIGGTETTRVTINWLLLYISNYPEIQDKMQKEIDENIGTRPPVQSDRNNCPYIQAAIAEILRLRPVFEISLEHKTICDTEMDGYKIPKGTSAIFGIRSCHHDSSIWPEPDLFKPERFLTSDGQYNRSRQSGYMAFGLGRRACPGEKLGLASVFLIFTRFLQTCTFELEGGPGSANLESNVLAMTNYPKPYKVTVKRREVMSK